MQIISQLIVSSPWLAGGVFALLAQAFFASVFKEMPAGRRNLPAIFLFGLGGLLGYLFLAYMLSFLNEASLPALTPSLNIGIAVLSCALLVAYLRFHSFKLFYSSSKLYWLIFAFLFLLFFYYVYMQSHNPMFGWDAINHWGGEAVTILENPALGHTGTLNYHESFRHPKTILLINTWAAWSSYQLVGQGLATPWLLCLISLCMVSSGYVYWITRSEISAAVCALLTAALPLTESHTLIFGYAELWLASVVVASSMLIALGIHERNTWWKIGGVLVGSLALTIKNIGLMYATSICGALLCTILLQRPFLAAMVTLALSICAYILWLKGFLFEFIGMQIYWAPDTNEFYFGGRAMQVILNPAEQVFINELYSLAVHQSFSTAGLALVFSAISLVSRPARNCWSRIAQSSGSPTHTCSLDSAKIFLIFTAILSLLMIMLSQLYLPFSFEHALPHNDTGNSRFSIPFILLSIPIGMTMVTKTECRDAKKHLDTN